MIKWCCCFLYLPAFLPAYFITVRILCHRLHVTHLNSFTPDFTPLLGCCWVDTCDGHTTHACLYLPTLLLCGCCFTTYQFCMENSTYLSRVYRAACSLRYYHSLPFYSTTPTRGGDCRCYCGPPLLAYLPGLHHNAIFSHTTLMTLPATPPHLNSYYWEEDDLPHTTARGALL